MPRLFVDNLTVIDCSILDPQRGLIGASWSVNIELGGELDKQSMVFDFSKVKKIIKQWIDHEVDHKLLVPSKYDGATLSVDGKNTSIDFTPETNQKIKHTSPSSSLCCIEGKRISRKKVAEHITKGLAQVLPGNVDDIRVTLNQEAGFGRYYTYSHGLKKHDGNCQRIAHGHRSKIEVWKNNRRNRKLETQLAARWQDIYLGTSEDVSEFAHSQVRFDYQTDQGIFSLTLPEDRVYLMNSDTTVECIAEHLLSVLEQEMPNASFKVRAFEGISKGAIAESS
ncbi:MAG: 6-pyruvoyl-tetrahydropterin synthase [Arenicella sp.]|jgi:6-pyruvoyl-tetrahydropterin synthase